MSRGVEREKAIKEFNELLKVFEEGISKDFPEEFPFFEGKTLEYLDIVVGTTLCNYEAFHEVVAVVFSPEKNPLIMAWVKALKNHPLMKEMLPPHDKLVDKMREKPNPVHKKVPVLVHNGKSIAESLIILEYIEECWNTTQKLLPEDPYQWAKLRFWANYYDQKETFHEVVAVVFSPKKNSTIMAWLKALKHHPLMKEMLPHNDKLVAKMRGKYLGQSP
nr:glutathione S-transferase U2-like [Quercus suber]